MERVRLSRSSQAWRQLSARPAKAPGVPALGGSATPVSSGTDTHVCAPTNSRMARMSAHAEGNRPPSPCLHASLRPRFLFYSTMNPNRNTRNSMKTQGRSTSYSTTTPGVSEPTSRPYPPPTRVPGGPTRRTETKPSGTCCASVGLEPREECAPARHAVMSRLNPRPTNHESPTCRAATRSGERRRVTNHESPAWWGIFYPFCIRK